MTGYLGFYGPERPAKRSAGRVLVIALTAIASAICVGHSDAQQPAAAAPGSSGLLSVERIYSGPSLSGQLARGLRTGKSCPFSRPKAKGKRRARNFGRWTRRVANAVC